MRFYLLLFFVFLVTLVESQERKDIGVMVGTSYYIGDYNLGEQFYQPSLFLGGMLKHNFNSFYSVRAVLGYGWLKGSHSDNDFFLPPDQLPFSRQLVFGELDAEINFLPFDSRKHNRENISPYILLGFGIVYNGPVVTQHIPLGIGIKYSPEGRLTLGAEWCLRKTFSDKLDGYTNISDGRRSFVHNNDWFGIAGLFVTYRLSNKEALCPAYR